MIGTIVGLAAAGVVGATGYAFLVEPGIRLVVRKDTFSVPRWPTSHGELTIAVLTDFHICDPWMSVSRLKRIVKRTNALGADIILLLGDYEPCYLPRLSKRIAPEKWIHALDELSAPLGVHTIMGNHDWWDYPEDVRQALLSSNINLLENDAVKIERDGGDFWVGGLASMDVSSEGEFASVREDDLPATMAKITDEDPIIMMVHEPDIFPEVEPRIALTLAGHTHGGQVRLPIIGNPMLPRRYREKYGYGTVVEDERHMLVSGGLGCTYLPLRLGVPPEINLVTVTAA
ncbi:metallophosphoesterase [Tepidamorphus sp. 3E244]|uniref:metallophosphoesterase n=1 Tax=Tepidamorphus sp. 3E244 TaxID=3385498 RepID=UPI0038FC4430